jgi:hypothetical protein
VALRDREYMRAPYWQPGRFDLPEPPVRNPDAHRRWRRRRREQRLLTAANWLVVLGILTSLAFLAAELRPGDERWNALLDWIAVHLP